MRTYVPLAIVGVAACVAVYALNQNQASTSLYTPMNVEDHAYLQHLIKHGKSYGTKEEFEYRSNVFKDNLERINKINAQNGNTFSVAPNKFATWTKNEYKKLLGTRKSTGPKNVVELEDTAIPESLDWRTKGVVENVKDQGQCGSCWAFSGIGALESAHAIKTGKLVSLSEQQIVDCARGGNFQSEGCNGGFMYEVFQYAHQTPIETEAQYPYTAQDGTCRAKGGKVTDTSFVNVKVDDQQSFLQAIQLGPLSIAIEADQDVFQFYNSGVLNSKDCGIETDHGVLAVGYGGSGDNLYYIVKNSWGPSWGEKGYIRIASGAKKGPGVCGIQTDPAYPTGPN